MKTKTRTKVIPFEKMSRQQKRHDSVKIKLPNGVWQEMDMITYLKYVASYMPTMVGKDNKPIDHYKFLSTLYRAEGLKSIKKYINKIDKIMVAEQKKRRTLAKKEARKNKPLWRRILHV